ncbi:MAG: glycogen/starch/alpha-glucan phosphorylase [bacterium]|nr:glycogen/starch/alpha-glucan phosphorylase [bacterium]
MKNQTKLQEGVQATRRIFEGLDANALREAFLHHLEFSLGKDEHSASRHDYFVCLALAVRDRLTERWISTQQTYYNQNAKRVYYLSLEFLMGRTLSNSLISLDMLDAAREAMEGLGFDLNELEEIESDAGLGNGGLGRLAACFLDSMSTLELPAYGYGIRYEFGIFFQRIRDGFQEETPDNWLRYGNPWEIGRPENLYPVKFYGRVHQYNDPEGRLHNDWVDTQDVMAMAYDVPVPGYRNNTVNTLRLWSAKSTREFDLDWFNHGDYAKAVEDKSRTETITRVLYPNDNFFEGKELRLKQQFFFVCASLQDIVRRHLKIHERMDGFHEKNAIQLNDTHPAIAIPELMRVLLDERGWGWEDAWEIVTQTFAYTNHTVLPEALEEWSVSLMEYVLPRHMQIMYEINRRFLEEVEHRFPGDTGRLGRMSLIAEGREKKVRMPHLAIVGSHRINGVAELHSKILRESVFRDFCEMWPDKFMNVTNGVTQRRWLKQSNRGLGDVIDEKIGQNWVRDLDELQGLVPHAEDETFQKSWARVKHENKVHLAKYILDHNGVEVNPDSMFDCQVKRIHEYKRQLMNLLHAIVLYRRIKADPSGDYVPRTVILGGKAAPGYYTAKMIIRLATGIGEVVNNDRQVGDRLKVVFLANYGVSLAEKIMPAADLSEQISTAGMEASGTGNMKFALNGAITIGTLDGANIEILEEVGEENIFIFGLTVDEIREMKMAGYSPWRYYTENPELKQAVDTLSSGMFSGGDKELFRPILNSLLQYGDQYMVLADYANYVACQEQVAQQYRDPVAWTRMSILNCAKMGKFSSDRSIRTYAQDIWRVKPVPIEIRRQRDRDDD